MGTLVYRRYQRSLRVLILLSLILAETACNKTPTVTPTVTPTPTQGIIATFMLAVIRGQVVEEDVCLKIVYNDANMKDTLVFPPDGFLDVQFIHIRRFDGGFDLAMGFKFQTAW